MTNFEQFSINPNIIRPQDTERSESMMERIVPAAATIVGSTVEIHGVTYSGYEAPHDFAPDNRTMSVEWDNRPA